MRSHLDPGEIRTDQRFLNRCARSPNKNEVCEIEDNIFFPGPGHRIHECRENPGQDNHVEQKGSESNGSVHPLITIRKMVLIGCPEYVEKSRDENADHKNQQKILLVVVKIEGKGF